MNTQHYFKEVRVLLGKNKSAIYLNGELYLSTKIITQKMWADMVENNYIGDVLVEEIEQTLGIDNFPKNYSSIVK